MADTTTITGENQQGDQGEVTAAQNELFTENTTSDQAGQKSEEDGKKYSDEDVNKILNQKFAEWQKKKDAEISEAQKLAEMTEAQRAKHENEKLQEQLKELLKKDALTEMTKTARGILSEAGVSISDALISMLVSEDAEKTNSTIECFLKQYKDDVDKGIKAALRGNPPKMGASKAGSTMTKEEIINIKDPIERQKVMLQNKEMFGL